MTRKRFKSSRPIPNKTAYVARSMVLLVLSIFSSGPGCGSRKKESKAAKEAVAPAVGSPEFCRRHPSHATCEKAVLVEPRKEPAGTREVVKPASEQPEAGGKGMLGVLGSMEPKTVGTMFNRADPKKAAEETLGKLTGHVVSDEHGLAVLGQRKSLKGGGSSFGLGGAGSRIVAQVGMGKGSSQGGLDDQTIRRVLKRYLPQVRFCYLSQALATNPKLMGDVTLSFKITERGQVENPSVTSATLKHANTLGCIKAAMKRWRFPKPVSGEVQVRQVISLRVVRNLEKGS